MEHVDVQRVTLHPFTAVEEATQVGDSAPDTDPQASSTAEQALIWYATGQMPQMRAVRSGASVARRPRRKASKNRGGSKMLQLHVLHTPVANLDAQRPLALDRASPSTETVRLRSSAGVTAPPPSEQYRHARGA